MKRGGAARKEEDKVMGPLFPRLHVNDTVKGGPRAPPRNKMALYEQFSVPSHRLSSASATTTTAAAPWQLQPQRAGWVNTAVPSTSTSQVGGTDKHLFPSFCVPSNEPARSSEHINTNSNRQPGSAARVESRRQSANLKSKDTHAVGSTAECSSQHRENNIKNSSGKKLTNDDDFTVPSVLYSSVPPHSTHEKGRIQEKFAPSSTTSTYKNGPTLSKLSAKGSNTKKTHLEGMNVSSTRSRDDPNIKDKEPAKTMKNLEVNNRNSPLRISKEKPGRADSKVSSYRDRVSSLDVSDQLCTQTEGCLARSRKENVFESQNLQQAANELSSIDIESNGAPSLLGSGLREIGEKRKRSTGHYNVEQKDDSSDSSSVESLPGLEISPDNVVGAIGPKHFWKARRAIVNQQRVFAVQVFELHRLIKVQKLIAASPHLLIEGDPCLGNALVSKKQLAEGNVEKQLPPSKTKDDAQPTQQQAEHSKDSTDGSQPSLSQDDEIGVQQNNEAADDDAISSNPPPISVAPGNRQHNWCIPPPQNQWLVPVVSPSEGLVYKPYTGPCPPAGSFLAPFYASCAPLSLPSTAGDLMNSPYGIPMPHQPQHMGVAGTPPMPPMYFPPFSMPVVNPVVASASAVEQVCHVAATKPNGHTEQHSRSSCNMSNLRSEARSAGIWEFHASKDSEVQGSSASSPFDRQQGEGRASSAGNGQPQPSSGNKENPSRVIRVVPHTRRTASESAARIFRSIQMERRRND